MPQRLTAMGPPALLRAVAGVPNSVPACLYFRDEVAPDCRLRSTHAPIPSGVGGFNRFFRRLASAPARVASVWQLLLAVAKAST